MGSDAARTFRNQLRRLQSRRKAMVPRCAITHITTIALAPYAVVDPRVVPLTRSRISYFKSKFRKLGFIEYNGTLKVHSSVLKT